ncbi:hypothetical protein EVAR_26779_1 [Eumeta japonica]|uniref:Uncharacterized protein n=1 Tax=Eumeta variegata TaxID=151549 RepID=A0A4C1XCR6_EUMVA|nr:hypothetical protein EVAR_26779_1 [Eumeta japonica]
MKRFSSILNLGSGKKWVHTGQIPRKRDLPGSTFYFHRVYPEVAFDGPVMQTLFFSPLLPGPNPTSVQFLDVRAAPFLASLRCSESDDQGQDTAPKAPRASVQGSGVPSILTLLGRSPYPSGCLTKEHGRKMRKTK